MVWRTRTDVEIAALIGTRINVERTGVGIVAGVIDDDVIGGGPESCRTSYSTAKSITSTLVGAALHDGAIGSLDDRCDLYLPRLCGSAYAGVTIHNAMRMCSGAAWSDSEDGETDGGRLRQALVTRRPRVGPGSPVLHAACSPARHRL